MPARMDAAIVFAPSGRSRPGGINRAWMRAEPRLWPVFIMTPIPQLDYESHLFRERDIRSVTA